MGRRIFFHELTFFKSTNLWITLSFCILHSPDVTTLSLDVLDVLALISSGNVSSCSIYISVSPSRSSKFYIRMNNNIVDSIETGRIVIADLLP